jgi:hypothetical protein
MAYTNLDAVRFYPGVPPLSAFASAGELPLVIDITTGKAYYVDLTNTVQLLSSGGGGTGTVTHTVGALTAHAPVLGNGGADIKTTAAMTDGQILVGATGADAAPQTVSGDGALSATGVFALQGVLTTLYGGI